jgi:putative ABC transport system ATP-binding protein
VPEPDPTGGTPLTVLGLLRTSLRRRRRDVGASTLLVTGHQMSEAAVPVVVGFAIDRAVGTGDGTALGLWLGVVAGTFLVLASCGFVGYWLMSRVEFSIRRDLRLDIVDRAVDRRGGLGRRPGQRSGDLVGTAGTDASRASWVIDVVGYGAGCLAAIVAGAVVLLVASSVLALVVLVGAVAVLTASQLLSRPLVGRAEKEQETLAAATAQATDLVVGLRVIKGIGAEESAAAGYERTSRAALTARLHAARFEGAYAGATGLLTGLFLLVVFWAGGTMALDGRISVGELVAAIGLAQFLMEPLRGLAELAGVAAGVRGAAGRLVAVLGTPSAVHDGDRTLPPTVVGALEVRCGRVALVAAPGELVGVVAAEPDDLEPLLRALGRDDPDGTVLLDGTDLASVGLDAARAAVVVARHEAVLFEGTVADNLTPAGDGPPGSAADWAPALAATAADDVIGGLPDGTASQIGERGRQLSGGQRQRLVLARALLTGAPVLVLHDPTTAVDAATEDRIAEGVRTLRAGRTTLVLASSPALLSRCDRVVLVADGGVVAEGTHDQLLDLEPYRAAVLS